MEKNFLHAAEGHLIAPSFLAADFLRIKEEVEWLNQSEADMIHLDIMDGQFVPNISYGLPVVKAIQKVSTKPLDVHLMIHRPELFVQSFRDAGADIITVHEEACTHLHRTIYQIKESGALAGVSINPHTPVSSLEDVLNDIDLVLIMSVNPGFGGQKFIKRTYEKISRLKKMIHRLDSNCKIEVDGGVNTNNISELIRYGADVLVAGSAIFRSDDRDATLRQMKHASA